MTGAPVWTFIHSEQDKDQFLNLLDKFDDLNYVMCTIVQHSENQGLENLHAYSLISVHSMHTEQLLKIWNPWGYGEWTGKFSDKDSENWTEELKAHVGFEDKNDGIFFISIEDYLREYHSTTICFIDETKIYEYVVHHV